MKRPPKRREARKKNGKASGKTAAKKAALSMSGFDLPAPEPVKRTGRKWLLSDHNWGIIGEMARVGCTVEEITGYLGIGKDILYSAEHRDRYLELSKRVAAETNYKLRAIQVVEAMTSPNVVSRIWLGKQRLGQSDKSEITGAGGRPLLDAGKSAAEHILEILAHMARARAGEQQSPPPALPPGGGEGENARALEVSPPPPPAQDPPEASGVEAMG